MSEEKQEEIQNENCQCEEVKDNTADELAKAVAEAAKNHGVPIREVYEESLRKYLEENKK